VIMVHENDLGTAEQFPLSWSWTDAKWNLLPIETLNKIHPLVGPKADEACQHGMRFLDRSTLRDSLFAKIEEFDDVGSENPNSARVWLKTLTVEGDPTIFVSWGGDLVLLTAWSVFCEYWNDFCYPMEDVLVWPNTEEWAFFYYHEERLYFGRAVA
jgi:hypothetical protein